MQIRFPIYILPAMFILFDTERKYFWPIIYLIEIFKVLKQIIFSYSFTTLNYENFKSVNQNTRKYMYVFVYMKRTNRATLSGIFRLYSGRLVRAFVEGCPLNKQKKGNLWEYYKKMEHYNIFFSFFSSICIINFKNYSVLTKNVVERWKINKTDWEFKTRKINYYLFSFHFFSHFNSYFDDVFLHRIAHSFAILPQYNNSENIAQFHFIDESNEFNEYDIESSKKYFVFCFIHSISCFW